MYRSTTQLWVRAEKATKIKGTDRRRKSRIVGCESRMRSTGGFFSELHRRISFDIAHANTSTSAKVIALPKNPTNGPPTISWKANESVRGGK